MSVDWNLDDIHLFEFPIIQINFTSLANINDISISQLYKAIPIRLFILSHRIANFGIPSIFVESTPSYLDYNQVQLKNNLSDNIPSVIVFDIDNKFDDFFQSNQLPLWVEIKKFVWSLKSQSSKLNSDSNIFFDLCEEFFDDLQQAITLRTHYQYFFLEPLYFTTYILIPPQTVYLDSKIKIEKNIRLKSIIEPVIIQPVPIFIVNCIRIRWIIQPNLSCIVNPRNSPKIGSYILFPPFRHPLCITSITKETVKIYKNITDTFDRNPVIIPKTNPKVIPIPITKNTIKSISPLNFTVEETITITATTIDKEETITFRIPPIDAPRDIDVDYVLLTKPSIALHYFFYVKNSVYEYNKLTNKYYIQKKQQLQKNTQQPQPPNQTTYSQYCHFDDLEIFNFSEKDIDNFFSQHFSDESSNQASSVADQPEVVISTIEDTMPSPQQLVAEQVSDKTIKKNISKTINSILIRYNPNISLSEPFINQENDNHSLTLFTKRINLELPKISFSGSKCLSFFSFMNFSSFFGFSSPICSPMIGDFIPFKKVSNFVHLEIPSILLSQDGTAKEVPADNFLSFWESEKYMPISGPKSCHFVVFYETFNDSKIGNTLNNKSGIDNFIMNSESSDLFNDEFVNKETINSFMNQLSSIYSQLSFGIMKPFSKDSVYVPVKLQPLTKVTTFSSSSSKEKQSNSYKDTITSKIEIDIDSSLYECDAMKRSVFNFIGSEPHMQFQDFPVVAFIVGGPSSHFFTIESSKSNMNDQCPHLHTIYINPELIINYTQEEVKALAFEIYGSIREYKQGPVGNIEFMRNQKLLAQKAQIQIQQLQSQSSQNQMIQIQQIKNHIKYADFFYKLFFGFRYQPPFVLKNISDTLYIFGNTSSNNAINLNIAWDRFAGVAVWSNDTGDLLHSIETQSFNEIVMMISALRSASSTLIKKISISLLEEYLGKSYYEMFMHHMPADVDLFAIYPAPSVKVRFSEPFKDDVIVFENQEVKNGIGMIPSKKLNEIQKDSNDPNAGINLVFDLPATPEATCYVLSHFHPAYKVSIYKGGGQERLLDFVKKMSHLSWLSVKPGYENRTSAYPPHINALIQQNKTSCSRISQFEFLPVE